MFWSLFLVLLSLEFTNISIWVNKTMAERNNHLTISYDSMRHFVCMIILI